MTDRSNLDEVRNPVLALPSMAKFRALDPAAQEAVREFCRDLAREAKPRADMLWNRNKAPMATYWKLMGVYFGHLGRALSRMIREGQIKP